MCLFCHSVLYSVENSQTTCHQCTKKCFIAGHWGLACFDNFPGMEKGEFLG